MKTARKAAIAIGLLVIVGVAGTVGFFVTEEMGMAKIKADRKEFVEILVNRAYPGHEIIEYAVQSNYADKIERPPTVCGWVTGETSGPHAGEPIPFLFESGSFEAQRPLNHGNLLMCVVMSGDKSVEELFEYEQARFIEANR